MYVFLLLYRRYVAMVEMCQVAGNRDQLITLLLPLVEHVLNIILIHFQDRYASSPTLPYSLELGHLLCVHGLKLWPFNIGSFWCFLICKVWAHWWSNCGLMIHCRAYWMSFLYFLLLCSSVVSNSTETMKAKTYGAKSDSGDDICLLCGKLIPILERLELLNEVYDFSTSFSLITNHKILLAF